MFQHDLWPYNTKGDYILRFCRALNEDCSVYQIEKSLEYVEIPEEVLEARDYVEKYEAGSIKKTSGGIKKYDESIKILLMEGHSQSYKIKD